MHGGGEVVAERLRRVLNHLAGVRGADAGYDDDYTDDGPPVPADYPGLFSDDVSCGLCDVTLAYGDCLVLFFIFSIYLLPIFSWRERWRSSRWPASPASSS